MNNEETSNVPDEEPILDEELETELNEDAPAEATETEATSEETEEIPEEEKKEEEEKPKRKRKGKPEEEIVEEKIYTIPLAKATIRPPKKRAPRAIQLIREFITKHMKIEMKVEEEEEEGEFPRLIISREVNEKIWDKGIEKPPRRIRVRAAKDSDGNVTVYLAAGE